MFGKLFFFLLSSPLVISCGGIFFPTTDEESSLSGLVVDGGYLRQNFSESSQSYTVDIAPYATTLSLVLALEENAIAEAFLSTDPNSEMDDIDLLIVDNVLKVDLLGRENFTIVLRVNQEGSSSETSYVITVARGEDADFAQIWDISQLTDIDIFSYIRHSNEGISLDIDEGRIVIGIPYASVRDGEGASEPTGAALILEQDENRQWQSTLIQAPNPGARDAFGAFVALQGDMLAVSAPYEAGSIMSTLGEFNDDERGLGAVYVYLYNQTTKKWTPSHYLKPRGRGSSSTYFGSGLDIWFDTNEQEAEIVVGAFDALSLGSEVEIFRRNVSGDTDTFQRLDVTFPDLDISQLNTFELSKQF